MKTIKQLQEEGLTITKEKMDESITKVQKHAKKINSRDEENE